MSLPTTTGLAAENIYGADARGANIGGQPFNGTEMNLGGGMLTFNGNVGGGQFNTNCMAVGNITTCN